MNVCLVPLLFVLQEKFEATSVWQSKYDFRVLLVVVVSEEDESRKRDKYETDDELTCRE